MTQNLLKHVRESFSAKIIALVIFCVVGTSIVVGVVTTSTTRKFLTEKAAEKFPSSLTSTYSKIRNWYRLQSKDLERLARSPAVQNNVDRIRSDDPAVVAAAHEEAARYLSLVREEFPLFEELVVLDAGGQLVASTSQSAASEAPMIAQLTHDLDTAPPFTGAYQSKRGGAIQQWLIVPSAGGRTPRAWMAARIDLRELTDLLTDSSPSPGGDLFVLDGQGRFLTQPRREKRPVLWERAMQVPTRQEGPVVVETRSNYAGAKVFHSKVHLPRHGWWLVYEDDYALAMAPVISAQRRIWIAVLLIGVIAVIAGLRIAQSILRPIRGLADGASKINEGLVGVRIERGSDDEIGSLTDTFNEMAQTITLSKAELQYKNKMLNSQNDQLHDMNQRLEQLSVTDGLTGLFNHRHFWNILDKELARVDRYQGELALILVDLDDFKRVNDQFGHSVGDLLLQSVARILRQAVRDTDVVARYGGEEFAVLLPETDRDGVESVAEKTRQAVESMRFKVPDTDIALRVTVSIGISVFRGNRRDFFNSADKALYQSKAAGKNRVNFAVA